MASSSIPSAPSTAIDPAVLERIDTGMLAERHAARQQGPDAWVQVLRAEALRRMTADFGVPVAEATIELETELSGGVLPVEQALEEIVFAQRVLAALGETESARAALIPPEAPHE